MEIKGDTYKERSNYQLAEWVKGNSIHNDIDDECCPDFACCSNIKTDKIIREAFKGVCEKADEEGFNPDHHPWYDAKMAMLMGYLGNMANNEVPDKKVYIAGEEIRQVANKN